MRGSLKLGRDKLEHCQNGLLRGSFHTGLCQLLRHILNSYAPLLLQECQKAVTSRLGHQYFDPDSIDLDRHDSEGSQPYERVLS